MVTSAKKKAWGFCGGYIVLIYGSLYIMRPLSNYLRTLLRGFYDLGVSFVLLALGVTIFCWSLRTIRRQRAFFKALFVISILSYVFALYYLKIPEERVHLIEYGALALLVLKALQFDFKREMYLYSLSFIIVSGVGAADEFIQYLLPNRVGDVKDIMLNSFSGLLGLTFIFSLRDVCR